jgi:hypothetical protein
VIRGALLLIMATVTVCCDAEEAITIPTRDGAKLSYFLVQDKSAVPKAVAILFVGGLGAIGQARRAEGGPVKFGPGANFLARIREQLVDADIADAIVDSPSDKLPQGMEDEFRLGADHLADMRPDRRSAEAISGCADLSDRHQPRDDLRRGACRQARRLGARRRADIDGDQPRQGGRGAFALRLQDDQGAAAVHPPSRRRVFQQSLSKPRANVENGFADQRQRRQPAQSGPCDPQSPHGYFGRDAPVVQAMKNWMLGRAFVRDIK